MTFVEGWANSPQGEWEDVVIPGVSRKGVGCLSVGRGWWMGAPRPSTPHHGSLIGVREDEKGGRG